MSMASTCAGPRGACARRSTTAVSSGLFAAAGQRARARRRLVLARARTHARRRRRIGLRQEHAGAPDHDDRDADRGQRAVIGGVDATGADAATRRALRQRVQMVFQNPFASLNPRKKIGHALEEPLAINTTLGRAERDERGRAMLARVGLRPEHYRALPAHVLGRPAPAHRDRARADAASRALVVADEPVSALDVSIQAQVLNLLMDLQDDRRRLRLHLAQPRGRRADRRRGARDVPRQRRRARAEGRAVRRAAPSVHARAARQHAAHRRGARRGGARARSAQRALAASCRRRWRRRRAACFHTRCPYAIDRCAEVVPPLEPAGGAHAAACIRQDEIG